MTYQAGTIAVRIPGVEFPFEGGATVLVIPPLALGRLKAVQGKVAALQSGGLSAIEPEAVDTVIEVAHAALKRNYPEITLEEVGDLIDVSNMGDVLGACLDVAGLIRKEQEAKKATPSSTQASTAATQSTT